MYVDKIKVTERGSFEVERMAVRILESEGEGVVDLRKGRVLSDLARGGFGGCLR